MTLSRNSWIIRLAYLPEIITRDKIPNETSSCSLIPRLLLGWWMFLFLVLPCMVIVIAALYPFVWIEENCPKILKQSIPKSAELLKSWKDKTCVKVKIE